jgi:pimeloyl-ACP methyl ester carboxylesterase
LTREGFHVLRFDWSGTGDSWGDAADGTLPTWLGDVETAAQELREASGARTVSIVGMRLGAAIAALAVARGLAVRTLVLWEPVIRGADYIADLEGLDARENLSLLHRMRTTRDELVGYPFSPELRRSIRQIDLVAAPPRGAERVVLVSSSERADLKRLNQALGRAGVDAQRLNVSENQQPVDDERRDSALLGNEAAVAITVALAGRRSAA